MEAFAALYDTIWFQTLLKLILGALLTGIIGLERSSLNKPAGFGTHAILGVSSVLIVLCSEYLGYKYDIDMSRIPAQLLPAMGFIGAGTIIRNGLNVKGVTTAAGLLAVTCIGMSIGAGYYIGGILATIIVYLTLAYAHNISDKFERFTYLGLEIEITDDINQTIKIIEDYFASKKIEIKGIKRPDKKDKKERQETIEIYSEYDARQLKKNQIITDLIAMDNINEVTEQE